LVVELLLENLVGHFEQGFLLLAQEAGILHLQVGDQISGVTAATGRKAGAGQPDFGGGGRFRQQGLLDPGQGRNVDDAAGQDPEDADRQVHVNVVTVQAEEGVGPGAQGKVEIAGLTVFGSRAALSGDTQFFTRQHGGRNTDGELAVGRIPAAAFTVGTVVVGEVALALAGRTGLEAALAADAPAAVTGTAHGCPAVAAPSAAVAGDAGAAPFQGDGDGAAEGRLGELHADIEAVVFAPRAPGRRRGGVLGGVGRSGFADASEMLKGLPGQAELFMGLGVGVAVGVPAHGETLEGALDLGRTGVGGDPQDLVKIGLGHFSILIGAGRLMAETEDVMCERWAFFAWLGLISIGLVPARVSAETLRVGPGESLLTVAEAAALARDGDTVEVAAASYIGDVAVWPQRRLTIRGVGGRPRMLAAGQAAEQKGIWVIRGDEVVVDNIAFEGARGPNRNGSGIRHEEGALTVRNCEFRDNEMGILTANKASLSLVVENSEFSHGVLVTPRISHLLYAGRIGRLEVRGSYFHHGRVGHLLKSRARENLIEYNRLTDEAEGQASYELDFPDGGQVFLIGNLVRQSVGTENRRMIAFGAEGLQHDDNVLVLAGNTLVDDLPEGGEFVAVWSPERVQVAAVNNLLVGGCVGSLCPDAVFRRSLPEAGAERAAVEGEGNVQVVGAEARAALEARGFRRPPAD
jgi:hypothetical protein